MLCSRPTGSILVKRINDPTSRQSLNLATDGRYK